MSGRVYGLEGMRGIAAFWVYTHHFLLIFYPGFYFGQHTWLNSILNPDLAVSWFFVHSGFVLSYKGRNLEGEDYKLTLVDQSLRRYFRLVPPVLASILLTYVVMKFGLNFNHEYGRIVQSSWLSQYLNFTPNFLEAIKQSFFGVYFDFHSSTTFNPSLWTIGYELISSYILFAALAIFGRFKNAVWIFFVLGLTVSPWKGLMCFMIGAFLTRLPPHRPHWSFILLVTISGFSFSDLNGSYAPYARNLGAGLLMYALLQSPHFRKILAMKPFQKLGEISYSLYALHFLVLVSLTSYLGLTWKAHESIAIIVSIYVISTAVLLILSYLMWILIDRPGIQIARRFSSLLMNKPTGRTVP